MTSFHQRSAATNRSAVGIDLGTTFSAVGRVNELGKPEVAPNREGENLTPSVVLFDGEQPIVGTMAKRSVATAPLDAVQFVKRSMGDPAWRFETRSGSSWRPEEIAALILKRLKDDAEHTLNSQVTDAVVTVPAYFDDAPRRATIDAGTIAGMNVLRVLNEPTAAALAYGIRRDQDGSLLVYDLGGGTFDVTVLRIAGSEFQVLATHGDRNLGGFDFDNKLMQLLNERFVAAGGPDLLDDDFTEADLRERTEVAKHSLTSAERTTVTLSADGFTATIPVTRAEFDDACSSLLSRTRDIAELVLDDAGIAWHQLDRLLLAGGSTRMPMVRNLLSKLSNTAPELSTNPDEVVAHGAAIQAKLLMQEAPTVQRSRIRNRRPRDAASEEALLPRLRVRDVTSQGLGVYTYKRDGGKSYLASNSIIIEANTPIPASGTNRYRTLWDRQRSITWTVTQGSETDPNYVRVVGEQTTDLPGQYPAGSAVYVTLHYDENQVIRAEVDDATSGKRSTFTIENVRNMTPSEVDAATARIQSRPIG